MAMVGVGLAKNHRAPNTIFSQNPPPLRAKPIDLNLQPFGKAKPIDLNLQPFGKAKPIDLNVQPFGKAKPIDLNVQQGDSKPCYKSSQNSHPW
jgi:hypothetical protein